MDLLPNLVLEEKVPAIVKGEVVIDYVILNTRPIPFEFEIDIKWHLLEYAKNQIPLIEEISNLP